MGCLGRGKDSSSTVLQGPRLAPFSFASLLEHQPCLRGSRPTATAEIVQKRGYEPPVEDPGLILQFVGSCGEQLRHLVSGQRKRSDEWQKVGLCWQPPPPRATMDMARHLWGS